MHTYDTINQIIVLLKSMRVIKLKMDIETFLMIQR